MKQKLSFKTSQKSPHIHHIAIHIPRDIVDVIFNESAKTQQNKIHTPGFAQGQTPIEYIKRHYKKTLQDHAQEFLLKYCVIKFLYNKLHSEKIVITGEPRLKHVVLEPGSDGEFHFELSRSPEIEFKEWKNFTFKAPKRKKYKDIDRQVDTFLEEELGNKNAYHDEVQIGDWVAFDIALVDRNNTPLLNDCKEDLWLKIGSEEADKSSTEVFLNKQIGDSFCSDERCFQNYFSTSLNPKYLYCIHIKDIVPFQYFSLDDFKHHFKLKTSKEIHQKLIEVFSFRNDLSQRRSMVEEAFKLLLNKHRFEIPEYLILRQQKKVLEAVRDNPDYPVYKNERNFEKFVYMLATKQVRESILIDHLIHAENIKVGCKDLRGYLNLLQRPRTKEFIYFHPPHTKIQGREIPLSEELLKQCCRREKTLNHVIYHLRRN